MLEVRTFDGELHEVRALIRASWLQDYREKYHQPVSDYSSIPFLEWNLKRPESHPDLLLGVYSDRQLIGFGAGIPVTLTCKGRTIESVLGSYFTIHPEHKGMGIGKLLAREGLARAADMQYELYYFVVDEGHPANSLMRGVTAELGVPYRTFHRFTFLAKPLNKKKINELMDLPFYLKLALPLIAKKTARISQSHDCFDFKTDLDSALRMINRSTSPQALSVRWTEEGLVHGLKGQVAGIFFSDTGKQKGLILFYHVDMLGCTSLEAVHPATIIDYACFENMSFTEKHRFVSDFCSQEKQTGSATVIIPTMPSFDLKPFYSNLFCATGRHHLFAVSDLKNLLEEPVKLDYLFIR